jgi:hypothetical protein
VVTSPEIKWLNRDADHSSPSGNEFNPLKTKINPITYIYIRYLPRSKHQLCCSKNQSVNAKQGNNNNNNNNKSLHISALRYTHKVDYNLSAKQSSIFQQRIFDCASA